ncbi:hypothetical protein MRX96_011604 [Rhipicephalus microplus]
MLSVWFTCCAFWVCAHGSSPPLLLVLSLDGFWYKYRSLYKTPHIDRLATEGVQAEYLRNAYVTKTFPNHFTIATGLYEESHGIVGNAMFDPVLNDSFDESSRDPRWWDNGHSLPIWAANQLHGGRSGSMMWPGGDVAIHGVSAHYVQSYDPSLNFSDRVDRVVRLVPASEGAGQLRLFLLRRARRDGPRTRPNVSRHRCSRRASGRVSGRAGGGAEASQTVGPHPPDRGERSRHGARDQGLRIGRSATAGLLPRVRHQSRVEHTSGAGPRARSVREAARGGRATPHSSVQVRRDSARVPLPKQRSYPSPSWPKPNQDGTW